MPAAGALVLLLLAGRRRAPTSAITSASRRVRPAADRGPVPAADERLRASLRPRVGSPLTMLDVREIGRAPLQPRTFEDVAGARRQRAGGVRSAATSWCRCIPSRGSSSRASPARRASTTAGSAKRVVRAVRRVAARGPRARTSPASSRPSWPERGYLHARVTRARRARARSRSGRRLSSSVAAGRAHRTSARSTSIGPPGSRSRTAAAASRYQPGAAVRARGAEPPDRAVPRGPPEPRLLRGARVTGCRASWTRTRSRRR